MLLEKWGPMLKAGDAIESDSAKLALAKVFENTYKEFKNHGLLTEAGMTPEHGDVVSDRLGNVNIRKNGNKGVMTGKLGYKNTGKGIPPGIAVSEAAFSQCRGYSLQEPDHRYL